MENNKQGKLKFWADSYKPEPDAKVWQSIESRLTQEPSKRKASILTLTVLRIAAIFVFVLVSMESLILLLLEAQISILWAKPWNFHP